MLAQTKDLSDFDGLVPELIYFVDRTCQPGWQIPEHPTEFHDLTWVLSGTACYRCNGQNIVAHGGDLLYIPQGSLRSAHTDRQDPMHCLAINFVSTSANPQKLPHLPLPVLSRIGHPEELREMYYRLNQAWLEKAPGYRLEIRGLLSLIIHWLLKNQFIGQDSAHPARRLALIQDYIIKHYAQAIDIRDLAELVHLNPVYCGAWFRRMTGLTVKQYINRIRIRKAADLLSTGGFHVSEAAYKCGFDDLYYFSKVFKRVAGYPPSSLIAGTGKSGKVPDLQSER